MNLILLRKWIIIMKVFYINLWRMRVRLIYVSWFFFIIIYLNQHELFINKDLLKFIEDEYNNPLSLLERRKHPRSDQLANWHYFNNKSLIKEIFGGYNIYFQDYNTFIIATGTRPPNHIPKGYDGGAGAPGTGGALLRKGGERKMKAYNIG
jgi:hypothetical protein